MKTLLAHPGTQYSHRLAHQLGRLGYLYKFITGVAFVSDSYFLKGLPEFVRAKISNRILDITISADQLEIILFPELIALLQLKLKKEAELVLNRRNEMFQVKLKNKFLRESDNIIGFDTSSWIIAERAMNMGKPFFLDQSIAHPLEKVNLFTTLRTQYPDWKEDVPQKPDRLVQHEVIEYNLATKIVVASMFTKKSLEKNGISPGKIVVNPYGIGPEFFQVKEMFPGREKIRFVYLGALGVRKGLPLLIETWMENGFYRNSDVLLAGPANEFAKNAVKSTPGMKFIGRVSYHQIPVILASCDCLVFPSYFEGFGQVILEAMASGLPVITTDATAGPDIIEDGIDGFVIPAGDKKALGNAMQIIAEDPALCYNMGKLAQQKARSFSWNSYGDRWKNIIDKS